ncbi:hypothetical protein TcCL_ESM05894 [Trypanosoma cruzi]|nr:hypothetical protein TcCL_ESM05894 [Trypanosoma cruzi]
MRRGERHGDGVRQILDEHLHQASAHCGVDCRGVIPPFGLACVCVYMCVRVCLDSSRDAGFWALPVTRPRRSVGITKWAGGTAEAKTIKHCLDASLLPEPRQSKVNREKVRTEFSLSGCILNYIASLPREHFHNLLKTPPGIWEEARPQRPQKEKKKEKWMIVKKRSGATLQFLSGKIIQDETPARKLKTRLIHAKKKIYPGIRAKNGLLA